MAITITVPNVRPYNFSEKQSVKLQVNSMPTPPVEVKNNICLCDYECGYVEKVYALDGGEWWKNDQSSWLFKKYLATDSIVFKLYKEGIEISTMDDNTYGEYFHFLDQDYIGYRLEWEKVAALHGWGVYQIKVEQTIIGSNSEFESNTFLLSQYSDEAANKSVRIESYQNGNIIGSDLDLTNLNWYSSYRIDGLFTKSQEIEIDNYLNEGYVYDQIQDKINDKWLLQTKLLPSNMTNKLIYDTSLANEFLVTDYNILNHEIYRRESVYPTAIGDIFKDPLNSRKKYTIEFDSRKNNWIKRNF